ncbi:hypothetical protein Xoosp13_223 [Xanthomonas phage Xoo-sp13]|nr:hypothetical protein Xoosp13_223 [Xanthomonas phage Xoo-sp13]
MAEYNIKHTDRNIQSITVNEQEFDDSSLDVTLAGRIAPEYGESVNRNLLNILENFACPEKPSADFMKSVPDISRTSLQQLTKPTIGQFWFNSTRSMTYYWDGLEWKPLPLRENYAANWGSIMHGQRLPRPVSPITGLAYEYDDCIWMVSPAGVVGKPSLISCGTDSTALVTMQYRLSGTSNALPGLANYLIIGIRGNYNNGVPMTPTNIG